VNYIAAVGIHYAKLHKIPMVLHIASQRNVEKLNCQHGIKGIFDFLYQTIAKYVIRNANKIICQAQYQNMLLQSNYGRSCNIILPNFHPIPEDTIKKSLPAKIVWIANIKQLKQPELFVELAETFQDNDSTKFIMIGRPASGAWQRRLFERMNRLSNLAYRGELSIDEVNEVLSESHIFVNTSRYEGFPNTYIQAWMRKVPVVALNFDPDDVIKNPLNSPVKLDSDIKYILAIALSARATETNAGNIIKYCERLATTGEEFSQFLITTMLDRTGGIRSPLAKRNKDVRAYLRVHARDLYMEDIDDAA